MLIIIFLFDGGLSINSAPPPVDRKALAAESDKRRVQAARKQYTDAFKLEIIEDVFDTSYVPVPGEFRKCALCHEDGR